MLHNPRCRESMHGQSGEAVHIHRQVLRESQHSCIYEHTSPRSAQPPLSLHLTSCPQYRDAYPHTHSLYKGFSNLGSRRILLTHSHMLWRIGDFVGILVKIEGAEPDLKRMLLVLEMDVVADIHGQLHMEDAWWFASGIESGKSNV